MGWEKYKPVVRPAVLTAFLGYVMVGAVETNASETRIEDMTPIARILVEPALVVVRSDSPFKTLREFTDAAKAKRPYDAALSLAHHWQEGVAA